MLKQQLQKTEEEFDNMFGVSVLDEDGYHKYSLGELAGCDDCLENADIRKKHKKFIRQAQIAAVKAFAEEVRESKRKSLETMFDKATKKTEILSECCNAEAKTYGWMPMYVECLKCGKKEPVFGEPNTSGGFLSVDGELDKYMEDINNLLKDI